MANNLEKLNKILLNDNVVESFYNEYKNEDFKNWLLSILPEVEKCRLTKQDNPWHIYDCLDHILHAVDEINKLSQSCDNNTRRQLAYTMFLHDIGKPECKLRRYSKLYKREIDSFFNHNLAGVKVGKRVLDDFGFNEKEIKDILTLIEEHDIFMFITLQDDGNPHHHTLSSKYMDEIIEKLNYNNNGQNLMQYLLWVGRADNLAQNPEMTQDSLHLLSVMDKMLSEKISASNL